MDNLKTGGSFNLLSCYDTFNISITSNDRHDICTPIYEDNMYEEVEEYHDCLKDLGGPATADVILLDHNDMIISVDERKLIMYPVVTWNDTL